MKFRAVGTGGPDCRHPLVPGCFLLQSESANVLIGAPHQVVSRLQQLEIGLESIDAILVLSPRGDQVGGLEEIARFFLGRPKKPMLLAPEKLMTRVRERLEPAFTVFLQDLFNVKSVVKFSIAEEHQSETLKFVPNYLDAAIPSFGLRLEEARIFISGETGLNETWLFKEMGCDVILHSCVTTKRPQGYPGAPRLEEFSELPVYLQNKIWLYGYHNGHQELAEPLPVLFLPQGVAVYDGTRRDRVLNKERYIRESAKKSLR